MQDKIFTTNFIKMFTANAVLCSGFYMLMPILPVFAIKNLGISTGSVGVIIGIFAVSSVVSRILSGALLDRYGRMVVYIPSLIIFGLCFGMYAAAASFATLMVVRILHGISWGTVSTATSTIVSDIVPIKLRGTGLGYFGLSMNVAMALGPAVSVFLIDYVHINVIFAICVGLSFFALLISGSMKPPVIPRDVRPLKLDAFFEVNVLPMAFLQFLYGVGYAAIMSYALLHGMERGISGLGSFFLLFAVFISILRPYAGKVMDRQGPTMLLVSGYLLLILGYSMLGAATSTWVFLVSAVPIGLGAGFIMPVMLTMTINVVTPQRRGAANATFFSAFDVGIGLGSIALGVVAQHVGYGNMFYFTAIFTALPLVLLLVSVKPYYERMYKKING